VPVKGTFAYIRSFNDIIDGGISEAFAEKQSDSFSNYLFFKGIQFVVSHI
jgi:hypothetical protein